MLVMKRIHHLLLLSIVIVVFIWLMFNWTISVLVHQRKEVIVPAIEGKSLFDAVDMISKFNLGLKKEGEEFHPDLPQGTITKQNPPSGMVVREGKIIKVIISQGSELIFVPSIIGETARNAELKIRKYYLKAGTMTEVYSLKYEKGKVVSQTPEPDSIVKKNTPIDLIISSGEPRDGVILMPDFVGESIQKAKKWAEENNLNYEIAEEFLPGSSGKIINQEPALDRILMSSDVVKLVVAIGSEYKIEGQPVEGEKFYYEVPQGAKGQKIRLMLIDDTGEREIFSNVQSPGSKIDIPLIKKGKAKIRVFINNILVEEREL
ncbi:MAG: hypothetical protein COS17_05325 [Elusimicrobia bacterium CG02_land_8_20_14_3_00_37_13]|nr:MAG: hypothetical protein COS17_05325 [Elusimicrobia bacterium CG02_land_8_20_14_3_00_37_13]